MIRTTICQLINSLKNLETSCNNQEHNYLSEEEIIRRIDAVTLDDIRAILPTVCDFSKMTAVFVGRTAEYAQELEDIIRGRR